MLTLHFIRQLKHSISRIASTSSAFYAILQLIPDRTVTFL